MGIHDVLGNGQPQTCARGFADIAGAEEILEDVGELILRDAWTFVLHFEDQRFRLVPGAEDDHAAHRGEFNSVVQQVGKHLTHAPARAHNRLEIGRRFHSNADFFLCRSQPGVFDGFCSNLTGVEPFKIRLDLLRAHARQVHHIAD